MKAAFLPDRGVVKLNGDDARHFLNNLVTAELGDLIAFAQTPTGRHYLARADVVESDPAIMDASMAIMEALGPALQDMAKEACAKHTAERIAAGDKKATCPLAKAAETAAG